MEVLASMFVWSLGAILSMYVALTLLRWLTGHCWFCGAPRPTEEGADGDTTE